MSTVWLKKIKEFWIKYETKLILLAGFVLVSIISFGGGYFKGKSLQSKALIIEEVSGSTQDCPQIQADSENGAKTTPTNQSGDKTSDSKNCPFVGSKNSNKFYPPSCSYAKRIKPENLVCFQSKEEALAQGRTESVCK